MKHIILFLFLACFLYGCKTKSALQGTVLPVETTSEPEEELEITDENFEYPANALYVIAREYELMFDTLSAKSQTPQAQELRSGDSVATFPQYLEKRLIQLYPNKAFKNMLAGFDRQKADGMLYQNSKIQLPPNSELAFIKNTEATKADPFHLFVSMEDEMNFLNMTEYERRKYMALNKLASSEKFADSTDFKNLNETFDSIPPNLEPDDRSMLLDENVFLSCLAFAGGGSYIIYRISQSKERAIYMAIKHYGKEGISCGKKGDAYKHLSVNVLIKRYLTEEMAYLVMDGYWENRGNNSPCDKHMDLHNNYVGRHSQYHIFRGNTWENRYDWEKWLANIHAFVEDEQHNAIKKPWNKKMLEQFVIKDTETVNRSKYIFWNKTTECEP